jgi:hypothetical protein
MQVMDSKIPIITINGLESGRYVKVNADYHAAMFKLRGWTPETAPADIGVSKGTMNELLYRRNRRDENGQMMIEVTTLFKLHMAYQKYPPLFKIVRPPQGPPVRRTLENRMRGPYPGMAGRRQLSNNDDD